MLGIEPFYGLCVATLKLYFTAKAATIYLHINSPLTSLT